MPAANVNKDMKDMSAETGTSLSRVDGKVRKKEID